MLGGGMDQVGARRRRLRFVVGPRLADVDVMRSKKPGENALAYHAAERCMDGLLASLDL
jgi:hypothetical protein